MAHAQGQQHPIGVYLKIWALLFVLSAASYAVDYFHVQSYLRWTLITVFMLLKAGLIVAVFMHMVWERLALMYAVIVPPLLLLVFVAIGALEADYTFFTRGTFFKAGMEVSVKLAHADTGSVRQGRAADDVPQGITVLRAAPAPSRG